MEGIQPPSPPHFEGPFPKKEWERFKEAFELYKDIALVGKNDAYHVKTLKYLLHDEGREVYKTLQFTTPETERKLSEIIDAFDRRYQEKTNEDVERFQLFTRKQQPGEDIEAYITQLKKMAERCELGDLKQSLTKTAIMIGIEDTTLRARLLRVENLTLEKCEKICKADKLAKQGQKTMETENNDEERSVDAIRRQQQRTSNRSKQPNTRETNNEATSKETKEKKPCGKCGTKHKKRSCPAFGSKCHNCGGRNHWAKMCFNTQANELSADTQNASTGFAAESLFVDVVVDSMKSSQKEWIMDMHLNSTKIPVKVDTGAECNLLPMTIFKQIKKQPQVNQTNIKVRSYTSDQIPIVGQCIMDVECKDREVRLPFLITSLPDRPALIGYEGAKMLKLISSTPDTSVNEATCMNNDYRWVKDQYATCFEGLGCLPGKHAITLKEGAVPMQDACRKVPFQLKDKLQAELQRMEELKVIEQVDRPTEWVNSIVIVSKKNGDLRVCLDPRNLNKMIEREHYKLPSRDEILGEIGRASYFTKLDAMSGFWQIQLDEPSSYLTTFITPYGRYRYLRLPFGISMAPEAYHKKIHTLFQDIQGVNTFMDDIIIWGNTKQEHDERLEEVLKRARNHNLKLNEEKCEYGAREVTFLGDLLTSEGVKVDPQKVEAILTMPAPQNKTELQRFLGMVNYLGKFIPDLSTKTAQLRVLLDNKHEWMWEAAQEEAFQALKVLLTTSPVLKYYEVDKKIKISSDASKTGLGAVLLQLHGNDWCPVAYASRSMTDAEQRYAQIEKECLAVTYACERFHQFIYGANFEAETDHKPLIAIFSKPLADCPLRLQRMRIRLQKYDLQLSWTPGKFMYTADTLSRGIDDKKPVKSTTEEDVAVYVNMITSTLAVSQTRLEEIKQETRDDQELAVLKEMINSGWPDERQQCPIQIRAYWDCRDSLTIVEDVIFKAQKIVIPAKLRNLMLGKIHEGHFGVQKCLRRARAVMYWPGMNRSITEVVQKCNTCLLYRPNQQREPLQPHQVPEHPWEKVGADLFTESGKNYIVLVDYFSQYIEVFSLNQITTPAVVRAMKSAFARHGTPLVLVTDNGPQLVSEDFKKFTKEWDFTHVTSSPHFAQSNGQAENAVKIAKNIVKKANHSGQDLQRALQIYRSTPLECGKTPAELLFNRQIRSNLPMTKDMLKVQDIDTAEIKKKKEAQKAKQKQHYDLRARPLKALQVGDKVRLKTPQDKTWSTEGTVVKKLPHRSYRVKLRSGVILRRNRRHIRCITGEQSEMNDFQNDDMDNPPELQQHGQRQQQYAHQQQQQYAQQQQQQQYAQRQQQHARQQQQGEQQQQQHARQQQHLQQQCGQQQQQQYNGHQQQQQHGQQQHHQYVRQQPSNNVAPQTVYTSRYGRPIKPPQVLNL